MSALGMLLQSLFGGVLSFFTQYLGKKAALGVTFVAVFTAATAALYAALSASLSGLAYSLPSWPGMEIAMYVAAPPILPIAVSAVLTAEATMALYRINTVIMVTVAKS